MAKSVGHTKEAKEEYRKILEFLRRADANEPMDLKEMLRSYVQLFIIIKNTLETGSLEEQRESLLILSEVFDLFVKESKKLKEKTGATESDIIRVGENPNFFTPEQWGMIQEAKNEMNKMGLSLTDVLYKRIES